MKMQSIVKKAALPLLAAALVLGASAGASSSYFTTYVTAQGWHELYLRDVHVDVDDEAVGNVKSITVRNTTDEPCYVRVKVIQASTAEIEAPVTYAGEGWFDGGDGYWYYGDILTGTGDEAALLEATINLPTEGEKPPAGTTFNVSVIAECAKIFYDENGTPMSNGPDYAGWTLKEG